MYDGAMRTEAARIGDVTRQVVRDWVVKFNATGPAGLIDRAALAMTIESGVIPAIHGVVRLRLNDLAQLLSEELRVSIAKQALSREVRALNYRKLTARPRQHA
jgi:transposase